MKMLMMVVASTHRDRIEATLMERTPLGFTEIPNNFGLGKSGLRLGSRAFPETSSILLTAGAADEIDALVQELDQACHDCAESFRMFAWAVEQLR